MADILAVLEAQNYKGIIGALRVVTPHAPQVVANICAIFDIPPDEFRRWVDYPMPHRSLCYPDHDSMRTLWTLSAQHGWPLPGPDDLNEVFLMGAGRPPVPRSGAVINAEYALKRLGVDRELRFNEWSGKVEYRGADANDKILLPLLRRAAEAVYAGQRYSPTGDAMWAALV